jgi:type VI secretion system secreted protein VgrG
VPRTFVAQLQIEDFVAYRVLEFRETHELGQPPELRVLCLFDQYVDPEDVVGKPATLAYGYDGGTTRSFVGVLDSVTIYGTSHLGTDGRTYQYAFSIVSPLTIIGRDQTSRIFQDMDVKAIVSKVLDDHGVTSDRYEWHLTGTYPKREYCVQYQESALAFIQRLLEQEGIYYAWEASDGGPKLVFADDSTAAKNAEGDAGAVSLPLRSRTALHGDDDAIFAIEERRRVTSGKFVLRDFNFEKPLLDLTSTAAGNEHADLEVYDYPGGYFEAADGKRLAQTRLEAEAWTSDVLEIDAECTGISLARKMKIDGSPHNDGEYFVTAVTHDFVDGSAANEEHGAAQASKYLVRATLVPGATKYRPPVVTPVPVIDGPQTAAIVCPAGSKPEEIHTDKWGRAKVKFHWDLDPEMDDKASCWMRVSQLQTSGSMILPRVDWEVIIEFLEGNPDRPIVTGRLYNGTYMPPYALPEGKTRTAIKTASTPGGDGSNEIRMEDKSGSEELMMHSQYDTNITVANNKTKNVGNNETSNIGVDSSLEVGSNQTIKITKGHQIGIGADQTVSVGANRTVAVNAVAGINVSGDSTTSVGGNQMEMVGNPLEALLALAAEKAAEFLAAKAGEALQKIDGAVQSKVDQALGPIKDVTDKAGALGNGMKAVAGGDLGAAGGLLAGASSLPTAAGLAGALGGGGKGDGAGGPSAGQISAEAMLGAAAGNAIQTGVSKAKGALGKALGLDADGGGGESDANKEGLKGDVDGVDETDRAKGPGHTLYKVGGGHTEQVATAKITAALNGIITNVAGNMTQNVGAANVELVLKDRAEAVAGNKDEKAIGLVVVAKGDESEHVGGSRTAMVGGAVLQKIAGNRTVEAGANATFIGAFHKIDASSSITFKCGGSTVTIDGGGVTIQSDLITLMGPKVQLAKGTAEGG